MITGIESAEEVTGVHVIHAGTARANTGEVVAAGGRVLSVVAEGENLEQARQRAYQAMDCIELEGGHFRGDIAQLS